MGGSAYCSAHKCYTTTEFVLLGLGAVLGGVMVGVVGISWFKHSVGCPHARPHSGPILLIIRCNTIFNPNL